jgi:hypothetical protein
MGAGAPMMVAAKTALFVATTVSCAGADLHRGRDERGGAADVLLVVSAMARVPAGSRMMLPGPLKQRGGADAVGAAGGPGHAGHGDHLARREDLAQGVVAAVDDI